MDPEIEPQPGDHGTTALGRAGHFPKTAPRLAACGDVEEAELTIGTAISTDEMSEQLDELLRTLQADLALVRADLATPLPAEADRVHGTHIARIDALRRRSEVDSRGASSQAAEVLRLAAAVTRRAERAVRELVTSEPQHVAELPAVYLDHLAALLLVLADRAVHEANRRIPYGACGNPWLHSALAPDLDR